MSIDVNDVINTLISAITSLVVAFGTWHVSMRKDRKEQTDEVKKVLNDHREEYLSGIRAVQDEINQTNTHIMLVDEKISTLSERVDKHNNVIERTFKLENATGQQSVKIDGINHRLDELERRVN